MQKFYLSPERLQSDYIVLKERPTGIRSWKGLPTFRGGIVVKSSFMGQPDHGEFLYAVSKKDIRQMVNDGITSDPEKPIRNYMNQYIVEKASHEDIMELFEEETQNNFATVYDVGDVDELRVGIWL